LEIDSKKKKSKKKLEIKDISWKSSLYKSVIYRLITLVLGTITAYAITGSIEVATGTALLTEAVQGVNYFVFELIWDNIQRKKLEKKFFEKYQEKRINLQIEYSSLKEIAYDLSNVDTFVPRVYLSTLNFLNHLLKNKDLEEFHTEIQTYKDRFLQAHKGRKMFF
jgi:uncharacterized membrane protein